MFTNTKKYCQGRACSDRKVNTFRGVSPLVIMAGRWRALGCLDGGLLGGLLLDVKIVLFDVVSHVVPRRPSIG